MNHAYRLVWNEGTQRYVPVAEGTRLRGKSSGRKALAGGKARVRAALFVAAAIGATHGNLSLADPTGGHVTTGSGSISQTGNNTVINQQSQNLAINWNSFSIGANESVRFNQPNSTAIALNRVLGQSSSEILGNLSANGQVFILNPNGVLFGKGSEVNVGALVASTLNLSDADLQAGNFKFAAADNASGRVVNQGSLTAAHGGYLALLGPNVSNSGSLQVTGGTVLLAAGNKVSLQLNNGSLLSYSIDQGALDALAENDQLIQANGGRVFLSAQGADSVSRAVVNNTGIIEARTVDNHGGMIRLLGDSAVGQVNVGGTLDASAPNGGDGGAIETSAATVKVADGARISTVAAAGKTGTWLVDPTDFTIAASGGDISGATLSNELQSSNITLSSTNGGASGNGDLFVNDAVSWSSNNSLALNAVRDIRINSPISASGSGSAAGLTLSAGGNIQIGNTISLSGDTTALSMTYGSGDNYYLNNGAAINLPGNHVSLTIGDGTSAGTHSYTVINSLGVDSDQTTTTLQGIKNNLTGYYALGTNIDASSTSGWSTLGGFQPIGNNSGFSGQFHGLGHAIANLTIAPNQKLSGLFGIIQIDSIIRDVGIQGVTALGSGDTSDVGGLAGVNWGAISNSYVISSSSMTTTVTGTFNVGILVGRNITGSISGSHAAGVASITSCSDSGCLVGGLVGFNGGKISRSYASGTVINTGFGGFAGGLAGENLGLVNPGNGVITNSYFSGTVSGQVAIIGGLVGENETLISNSYAHATVSGTGGRIGGFVGENSAQIDHSYSTSAVSGAGSHGFVGYEFSPGSSVITNSYWVMSDGATDLSAAKGLTSAQAGLPSSYAGWDFASTWRIYNGHTTPLLKAFLTPLVISADSLSTTYNGSGYSGGLSNPVYSIAGADTSGHLNGIATAYNGDRNAGTYAPDLWSDQHGYDISVVNSALTINKAALTLGAIGNTRTYDGSTTAAATPTYSGLQGSDTITGLSEVYADKNAGTGKTLSVANGYTLNDGNGGNNYVVTTVNSTAGVINQAALTLTAIAATKTYDGTTTAAATPTYSDLKNGDSITGLTEVYADKNAGTGKTLSVGNGYTINDGNGGKNYTISSASNTTGTINKAALTVTTANVVKTYDGTTSAAGTAIATSGTQLFGTDSLSGGTFAFTDKNAGTGNKTVTVSGVTVNDGNGGNNYTVSYANNTTSTINPASLTIAANSIGKLYSGTNFTGDNGVVYTGFVNNESASVLNGTLSYGGTAQRAVNAGTYTLVPTGLSSGNYSISYVNGSLTISPAPLTITANDVSKAFDGSAFSGDPKGVTYSGFVAGQTPSVLGGTLTYGGTSQGALNAGSYTIIPSGLSGRNYTITYVNGTLTIAPATLSAIANSALASSAVTVTSDSGMSSADAPSTVMQ